MSGNAQKRLLVFLSSLAISICVALAATPLSYAAQTIVDEWNTVKAPPAPELKDYHDRSKGDRAADP